MAQSLLIFAMLVQPGNFITQQPPALNIFFCESALQATRFSLLDSTKEVQQHVGSLFFNLYVRERAFEYGCCVSVKSGPSPRYLAIIRAYDKRPRVLVDDSTKMAGQPVDEPRVGVRNSHTALKGGGFSPGLRPCLGDHKTSFAINDGSEIGRPAISIKRGKMVTDEFFAGLLLQRSNRLPTSFSEINQALRDMPPSSWNPSARYRQVGLTKGNRYLGLLSLYQQERQELAKKGLRVALRAIPSEPISPSLRGRIPVVENVSAPCLGRHPSNDWLVGIVDRDNERKPVGPSSARDRYTPLSIKNPGNIRKFGIRSVSKRFIMVTHA